MHHSVDVRVASPVTAACVSPDTGYVSVTEKMTPTHDDVECGEHENVVARETIVNVGGASATQSHS